MAASIPANAQQSPAATELDRFYVQHRRAAGIPVVGSAKVASEALDKAASLIEQMLAHRPDLARWLATNGYRVAIMAESEATTDLPEQAHWTRPDRSDPRLTRCERKHYDQRIGKLTDRDYWNARARGMAGPLTSGAAEDLLGLRSSRYWGETIFVHEFAHNVLAAIRAVDASLARKVDRAFANARKAGRWKHDYASTSVDEYWAEGTQFWFNSNRLAVFDGRRILNHADLAAYDPPLYAALGDAYGRSRRLAGDPFWMSPARVPPGRPPRNTAEVC
ncbi:glycoside hydrolase [Tsuneonella sp. HG249]